MFLCKRSHIFEPRKDIVSTPSWTDLTFAVYKESFLKLYVTFLNLKMPFMVSGTDPWSTLYNTAAPTCKILRWIVTDLSLLSSSSNVDF